MYLGCLSLKTKDGGLIIHEKKPSFFVSEMEFNCLVDIVFHLWVVFFCFDACKFLYSCEFDFSSARWIIKP